MKKGLETLPNSPKVELERYKAYQMIAVKDNGMILDFVQYLSYLFENNSENLAEELKILVEDEKERAKILEMSKSVEPLCVVNSRPNYDFWFAHYGHKIDSYFYQQFIKKLKEGRFAFILFGSNGLSQEELDYFVGVLKGSTVIVDSTIENDASTETIITLRDGDGIRGLAEADGVMVDEKYARSLAEIAKLEETILNQTLEKILSSVNKRILYSKLSDEFQNATFAHLPFSQQGRLMSNYIHAPDRGEVALNSLKGLVASDIIGFESLKEGFDAQEFLKLCK